MIISEQWLRDWIHLDLDVRGIADCLTNAGLEVDAVNPVAGVIDNLVVGKVLEVNKHPDADRLNLANVDIGESQLDIVCGAANVRPELMVAVATVGAKLPNGLKIKKAKVRGIESNGMLCSAAELGLEEESEGLIELGEDAEIGQRVDEYLHLDDMLIDIDLTPNRGDCLSVQGVARELKVLAEGEYHPLDIQPVEATTGAQIDIDLDNSEACPRYVGRILQGVDTAAVTPVWLQERLRRSGIRPISPVVDITNYVMLELGQPMHAFDLNKLNEKIVVRQARVGETIRLLDGSEATLDDETLVIADQAGPIAIAGVMGGADSAIGEGTQDIVLEAAHFTRLAAAGTARRYGLHTESSHRFERGVDPELPLLAMERATELVLQICGGAAGPVVESSDTAGLAAKPPVSLRFSRLRNLLGMELDGSEVEAMLFRIAENVQRDGETWTVFPPSYRFDIEREADLVEEVARVKGYDSVPVAMPRIAPRSVVASEKKLDIRRLRQAMVTRDYREAITYSFIDPQAQQLFSEETPIELSNPLAENMSVMRTSLIPGLLEALQFNAHRQHDRVRLFEIGASYHLTPDGIREVPRLAALAMGSVAPMQWGVDRTQQLDFYDIKGDLEAVLTLTGHKEPFIFNEFEHIALHPGQVSKIVRNDPLGGQTDLGWLGRLHPAIQKKYGLQDTVFAFEIDLDKAMEARLPAYSGVSRFPSIKRDISVVLDSEALASNVVQAVRSELGEALTKLVLFDVYRGEGVDQGQKSISLGLVLQHKDKTMTDEEAEQMIGAALDVLKREFGAELRS